MWRSGTKGLISGLQDYTVHDGYGLRSLVFLKGCPLKCEWCQNPEGQDQEVDVIFHEPLCIGCKACEAACPTGAIMMNGARIDRDRCTRCLNCIGSCPSTALSRSGLFMTVEEVANAVLEYMPFYQESDRGGVTLSGGEPTFQPEFALNLLKLCKNEGIHTAMETCGYTDYGTLNTLAQFLDLILYDLKHLDEGIHRQGTGVSNKLILENLRRLTMEDCSPEIVIRIPLIPGFNDDEKNVSDTARFIVSLGLKKVDLLPFNELPASKYRTLGKQWKYAGTQRQSDAYLLRLKEMVQALGLTVTLGGLW